MIAAFVVICAGVKATEAILTPVLLGAYLAIERVHRTRRPGR